MKLSDLYTTGTVAKKENGGSIAYVCTKTLDELYPDMGMDFDTSILLSNGSTSEMLNNGAYGANFTAYNNNNTLYNGEPTIPINFLGTVIVRDWSELVIGINLSRKTVCVSPNIGGSWNDIKNARFILNIVSPDGIGYNDYTPYDMSTASNTVYNFNSTLVSANFYYKTNNLQIDD